MPTIYEKKSSAISDPIVMDFGKIYREDQNALISRIGRLKALRVTRLSGATNTKYHFDSSHWIFGLGIRLSMRDPRHNRLPLKVDENRFVIYDLHDPRISNKPIICPDMPGIVSLFPGVQESTTDIGYGTIQSTLNFGRKFLIQSTLNGYTSGWMDDVRLFNQFSPAGDNEIAQRAFDGADTFFRKNTPTSLPVFLRDVRHHISIMRIVYMVADIEANYCANFHLSRKGWPTLTHSEHMDLMTEGFMSKPLPEVF